jgi:prepilin-type N-terminal cleavage/methylation domain-containing protein
MVRFRGFTLVELMIALALCLLSAGMGLRHLSRAVEVWRLQTAAQMVSSELTRLRAAAVSTGAPIRFVVRPSADAYSSAEPGQSPPQFTPLPRGIRFCSIPSRPVTFYSRGQAAPAGTFLLEGSRGRVRVVVAPMGRVRWQWED